MLYNLKIGGRIEVKTDDNRKFSAVIKAIAPGFNQGANNSIIRAKIEGDNLAIGSILSASINTQSGNQNLMPLVPTAAIIATESGNAVFVKTKNGFKLTNVLIGNSFNEKTEIKRGLKGDEEIAINNTFLLKSELAKGEVEHDH
jgi:cobalt-zinc-cadmium efflux system membrane fusion protein